MAEKTKDGGGVLGTDPYKGVRDFYPEDMFILQYIFATMREVAERFGYSEYGASVLEPTELYASKTSEEIVNEQTYTFTDRGDRSVTLRPEMTPSAARMVAGRLRDLSFPLRWYSIPNVFRYERPQRGRLREHWQLNCDIFGVDGLEAEVEIISLAYHLMRTFGAFPEDFEIRIGSRKALEEILTPRLTDPALFPQALRLFDRRLKMSEEDFRFAWEKISDAPLDFTITPSARIEKLLEKLTRLGITNARFDPAITRGFDYYTDIVFEVFDTAPENNRSLFGGGRYDNLLSLFGNDKVPAVGFGMGDVTIRDFLETRGLLPPYTSVIDLMLCVIEEKTLGYAEELAQNLRAEGLRVAIDFTLRKAGDQIKAAAKASVPFIAVIGDIEEASRTLRIKNLDTGDETEVPEGGIVEFVMKS